MKKLFYCFLGLFVLGNYVSAMEDKKDHSIVKLNLAFFVQTQSVLRGAQTYPYPSGMIGPSLTFFDLIQLRGPNIFWEKGKREDSYQWHIGYRLINDGAPLLKRSKFNEDIDYRSSRSDAWEVYTGYKYKFGPRKLFELGIQVAQEIYRHDGLYLEGEFKVPVYKFTSITFKTGFGDQEHNNYIYGPAAVNGITHQEVILGYVIPTLSWVDLVFISAAQSWVLKDENKRAELVRGHANQFVISSRLIWRF